MKKHLLIVAGLLLGMTANSQNADFELALINSDTSWFGQDQIIDGDTTFQSGHFTFENNFNAGWNSFTGWAFSNTSDVTTPGYTNQFSNITGTGESSNQFGICYESGNKRIFSNNQNSFTPDGAYFTNTTYAYLSMLNGDAYAKQFGSITDAAGNDDGSNGEDWLLLTIYGLDSDSLHNGDSVNFYLADYRFTDNNDDYLVNTWEWVDLSSLENVYGLDFKLRSSDSAPWGINTPSYFAMDNLSGDFLNINSTKSTNLNVYPNPTNGILNVELEHGSKIELIDINGRILETIQKSDSFQNIDLSSFDSGIYFLRVETNNIIKTQKIIRK